MSFGGGGQGDYTALGFGFSTYLGPSNAPHYTQPYLDIRALFGKPESKGRPFIAIQPGWTLYNKTNSSLLSTVNGKFAFNLSTGMKGRFLKNIGMYFAVGFTPVSYAYKNFRDTFREKINGASVQLGVGF